MFPVAGAEDGHAAGVARSDADASDGNADQLTGIGDQQHLVERLDREGRDHPPAAGEVVGDQALPASA